MGSSFAAFLGISILVIVMPGPDMALVMRNALLGGRMGGISTAFGVCSGQMVWTLAASAGVTALLVASEPAFVAVKLAGAAYLILLGVQSLRAAFGSEQPEGGPTDIDATERRVTPGAALRQGVISNLGNPKMAVFFASLLPQFAPGSQTSFFTLLLLGLVFCSLTLVWLAGYAVAVARAGDFLRRPGVRRVVEGLVGTVLVTFGLRLATEHR